MDLKKFVKNLKQMYTKGGEDNFLVVQAGDAYLQFAGGKKADAFVWEAVSNENLPAGKKLTPDQEKALVARGFEPEEGLNFSQLVEIAGTKTLEQLAKDSIAIFQEVYGVAGDAALEFELNLE